MTSLSQADQAYLQRVEQLWSSLQQPASEVPVVIDQSSTPLASIEWDVVICGGTLGIFIGAVLAQQGWRVALLERGTLQGRAQEWNISRAELQVLIDLNLLTDLELERIMVTQYNPARISFAGGPEFWIQDVLNIGVDPGLLLACLKQRFLDAGGSLFEQSAFVSATVHPNGICVQGGNLFSARLMLDAMGYFSPVVNQARRGEKPDSVCLVVGSCARGLPESDTGDLLYTFTPIQHQCQYFWEAFPAQDGRTTYLFTYVDPDPSRISLETLFAEYVRWLPTYQQVEPDQICFQRALFGCFPSYRQSPFQSPWDRVLAVGDSSGCQSPLSFGGFGAMLRHLQRLSTGIQEALTGNQLTLEALNLLQPYQPNLSVTWLFQKTMSVDRHSQPDPDQINILLSKVFTAMMALGEPVVKPFLQDVIQFSGLSQTLLKVLLSDPVLISHWVAQIGLIPLMSWLQHYSMLGIYTTLYPLGRWIDPVMTNPKQSNYYWTQWLQALKYGSGQDHR